MNKLLNFKKMHNQHDLLFLPNAWDVLSAILIERAGFQAIATSSAGAANAMGHQDGERIHFNELAALVKKIITAVDIPVTVDIESGYAQDRSNIVENALHIADLGAAGINIEDSLKETIGLQNKERHGELLASIRENLNRHGYNDFFINARIDCYLQQEQAFDEALERAHHYVANSADGIFVPGIQKSEEIKKLAASIKVPLNVMSLPNLTDADKLHQLGVKRFSVGNAFSDASICFIENTAQQLLSHKNTETLYKDVIQITFN